MAKKPRKTAEIVIDINANVANLSKDMKKVTKELDGLRSSVSSAASSLKGLFVLESARTAISTLSTIGSALKDIAEKGDAAQSVLDTFAKLGGSAPQIQQASEAVLGMVSSFELMNIANDAMLSKVPGVMDNFGQIADLGGRLATVLRTDTAGAIRQVVDALESGKVKSLEHVKIKIDEVKAYEEYGLAIGKSADKLNDLQKKEAIQIAGIKAIQGALVSLPETTNSVNNAFAGLSTAITDAFSNFSRAINENDSLRESFTRLAEEVRTVDWYTFGQGVSNAIDEVGRLLSPIASLIELFISLVENIKYVGIAFDIAALKTQEFALKARSALNVRAPQTMIGDLTGVDILGAGAKRQETIKEQQQIDADMKRVAGEIQAKTLELAFGPLFDSIKGESQKSSGTVVPKPTQTGPTPEELRQQAEELRKQGEAAKKAAAELQKLNEAWSKYRRENEKDKIEETDLSVITDVAYEDLKRRMSDVVRESFYEQWKEKMGLGGIHYEEVMQAANQEVHKKGLELDKKRASAKAEQDRKNNQETERQLNEAYGGLTQIGKDFGVDLGGVFDELSENFGGQMTELMDTIGKQLGTSGKNFAAYMNVAIEGIGLALNASSVDKANKSNKGTGGAIGYAGGSAIGAYFGGPAGAQLGGQIGKVVGEVIGDQFKWGPQNKETQARHVFANWLEEQLSQLKAVTLMDSSGKFVSARGDMMNFIEGDTSRFNTPGWANDMQAWGDQARNTFDGLGNALKGLLGITEDVGGQMSYLLGTNLGGNLDNARLLVYQLGLSLEDLTAALLKMAKSGEITWQQYAANVAGVSQAFEKGRVAANDMKGAVDAFIGSGGRGMAALKGIRDIAIEAIEGGAKSLDDLKQQLIKGGIAPEDADKFIQALRAAGVSTVQEIANMSEEQLGNLVATVGNSVDAINEKWKEIGTNLEKIKYDMDSLPTEKDIKINFKATFDDNMKTAKDNGLLNGENQSDFGEATPPPTTSRTRVSAKMSRGAVDTMRSQGDSGTVKAQSYNFTIDARGADIGVEERMKSFMVNYQDVIARNAAAMVEDYRGRGG